MFAASFLLLLATLSGTVLSFVYDRTAPPLARICIGAGTGLPIFAMSGYVFALLMGMGVASITLAVAVTIAPLLLLMQEDTRTLAKASLKLASESLGEAMHSQRARSLRRV